MSGPDFATSILAVGDVVKRMFEFGAKVKGCRDESQRYCVGLESLHDMQKSLNDLAQKWPEALNYEIEVDGQRQRLIGFVMEKVNLVTKDAKNTIQKYEQLKEGKLEKLKNLKSLKKFKFEKVKEVVLSLWLPFSFGMEIGYIEDLQQAVERAKSSLVAAISVTHFANSLSSNEKTKRFLHDLRGYTEEQFTELKKSKKSIDLSQWSFHLHFERQSSPQTRSPEAPPNKAFRKRAASLYKSQNTSATSFLRSWSKSKVSLNETQSIQNESPLSTPPVDASRFAGSSNPLESFVNISDSSIPLETIIMNALEGNCVEGDDGVSREGQFVNTLEEETSADSPVGDIVNQTEDDAESSHKESKSAIIWAGDGINEFHDEGGTPLVDHAHPSSEVITTRLPQALHTTFPSDNEPSFELTVKDTHQGPSLAISATNFIAKYECAEAERSFFCVTRCSVKKDRCVLYLEEPCVPSRYCKHVSVEGISRYALSRQSPCKVSLVTTHQDKATESILGSESQALSHDLAIIPDCKRFKACLHTSVENEHPGQVQCALPAKLRVSVEENEPI
ncbi:hypothetical protein B0J13DRAFT_558545, partial [Dactylonectria estremocensis]